MSAVMIDRRRAIGMSFESFFSGKALTKHRSSFHSLAAIFSYKLLFVWFFCDFILIHFDMYVNCTILFIKKKKKTLLNPIKHDCT